MIQLEEIFSFPICLSTKSPELEGIYAHFFDLERFLSKVENIFRGCGLFVRLNLILGRHRSTVDCYLFSVPALFMLPCHSFSLFLLVYVVLFYLYIYVFSLREEMSLFFFLSLAPRPLYRNLALDSHCIYTYVTSLLCICGDIIVCLACSLVFSGQISSLINYLNCQSVNGKPHVLNSSYIVVSRLLSYCIVKIWNSDHHFFWL